MNNNHKRMFTKEEIEQAQSEITIGYHDFKFDQDKPRSLIPVDIGLELIKNEHYLAKYINDTAEFYNENAIEVIAEVLSFGATKYQENSWQNVPDARQRYWDAYYRHGILEVVYRKKDKESGIEHWKHAITNLFFLLWFDLNK